MLMGINGQGKTTVLSYIVDSWYELIRDFYANEFKGKETTYYRISTSLYVMDKTKPSIVYIRYKAGDQLIDYLNIEAGITEDQYNEIITLNGKIPFNRIEQKEGKSIRSKRVSGNVNEDLVQDWLRSSVLTSFPSFRYELPYHITDTYKKQFEFRKDNNYTGFLTNPLMVVSGIDGITNWLMDLVLDKELYDKSVVGNKETRLWLNVNNILSSILSSKLNDLPIRFALGRRNSGASRISVVRKDNSQVVYPSIFGMSSGELAILGMFIEILRQADNLSANISIQDIQGIVVIDEIDKHLHIKLQKEVLPSLMGLFPNVQFIVSTHSPFLTMGLADNELTKERSKVIDLGQGGLSSEAKAIDIYCEVYDMMIGENENYKQLYDKLLPMVRNVARPLVITEGKTDAKHIKNAMEKLGTEGVDVEFFEIGNLEWGDSRLESILNSLSMLDNQRKIIGIFDRDNDKYVRYATGEGRTYKCLREGSNVYAFCIPLVNEAEYGQKISIEHYYHRNDLLKGNDDNRRLFLGDEFYTSGNSKDSLYQTKISNIQNKVQINGIIDEKVYRRDDLEQINSIAMSKDAFAELVCGGTNYSDGFDFSNFNQILDVLREICAL